MTAAMIRLNKFLAECGFSSRRKSEELILQGRVEINGKIVTELSIRVDPSNDEVAVDGEIIRPAKHIYILLNKPRGVITSVKDDKKRTTVVDLIKTNLKIFPVGRLDYNTSGVLLLTNDGDFSNLLTHPSNKVPKEYEVVLDKQLSPEDEEKLLKGIYIEKKKGRFTSVVRTKKPLQIVVTSVEGRNHFVKRMFGAIGYTVVALHRKSFAGILADIPPGSYRKLSDKEIESLTHRYGS